MSDDYMMFHSPGLLPQWMKRLRMVRSGAMRSMGTPAHLMAEISALFPQVTWSQTDHSKLEKLFRVRRGSGVDPDAPVWSGRGGPEFQLSADVDGHVKTLVMSRAGPREVRLLRRRLALVVLDLQADGLLDMLFMGP